MPQNNPTRCIDINLLQSCPERVYSKGCKVRSGDPHLPASCWGTYMPGDEPGNYCGISGQRCESGCMEYGECPRDNWPCEEEA